MYSFSNTHASDDEKTEILSFFLKRRKSKTSIHKQTITMVQFQDTTNVLADTTNATNANGMIAGEPEEGTKKTFRATPHPSKQRPENGEMEAEDSPLGIGASQVESVSIMKYPSCY